MNKCYLGRRSSTEMFASLAAPIRVRGAQRETGIVYIEVQRSHRVHDIRQGNRSRSSRGQARDRNLEVSFYTRKVGRLSAARLSH